MMRLCPFCQHRAFIDTQCPVCGAPIEEIRAKENSLCNKCRYYVPGHDMCAKTLNHPADFVSECGEYQGERE